MDNLLRFIRPIGAGGEGPPSEHAWLYEAFSLALLVLLTCFVVIFFGDYGVTWDEPIHHEYGIRVLNYYLSGFSDGSHAELYDLYTYGPLYDLLIAVSQHLLPLGVYETRHLLGGLLGILGVIGTWKLGYALGGPRLAFWSALMLALTPSYLGHMFNNPVDIPFAVANVWAAYYLATLARQLPHPSRSFIVKLGIALGCATSIRSAWPLLFAYLLLELWLFQVFICESKRDASGKRYLNAMLREVALPCAILCYSVMFIFWPWLHQNPIFHSIGASIHAAIFVNAQAEILYAGKSLAPATSMPFDYLLRYLGMKLPELWIPLLVLAAWVIGRQTITAIREKSLDRNRLGHGIFALTIVIPLFGLVVTNRPLWDGIRLVLFLLPLLCCAAAMGLLWIFDSLGERNTHFERAGILAVSLYLLYHISVLSQLHPYQYVYYNQFVGGLPGAQGNYELDYWGASYKEAVHELSGFLRDSVESDGGKYRVKVCGPWQAASYYFPSFLELAKEGEQEDFYIAHVRYDCNANVQGEKIATIARDGVALSHVYDRRHAQASR